MAWANTYGNGVSVNTSKRTSSSILFSDGQSITVRQWETVETKEVRALSETAATGQVPNTASGVANSDSTVQTQYWRFIANRTQTITVTTGTRKEYGAARRDETGQWVCTETTYNYFATGLDIGPGLWGTNPLDSDGNAVAPSSTGTEVVVSYERSTSPVAFNVWQVVTTTVKEYRGIDTLAHAQAVVNAHQGHAGTATVAHWQHVQLGSNSQYSWIISAWVTITYGTEEAASAKFVSAADGWVVTLVSKTYDWDCPSGDKASGSQAEGWYLGAHQGNS